MFAILFAAIGIICIIGYGIARDISEWQERKNDPDIERMEKGLMTSKERQEFWARKKEEAWQRAVKRATKTGRYF